MFAVASAQPREQRREVLRAVRETLRFGFTRCRLTLGRSLCSFARQLVELVLDGDLVGQPAGSNIGIKLRKITI